VSGLESGMHIAKDYSGVLSLVGLNARNKTRVRNDDEESGGYGLCHSTF
jgi:hypothetical protein